MPPSATNTTFQIGTWNPLTDAFTQTLDLNDGTTFRIHNKGLQMAQPDKNVIESGNLRTAGVVVPRWQYKPRHIVVEVWLRGATTTALLASIRSLLAAIEQPPYSIRLALPGSSQYTYADVLAVKHDIPTDVQTILAGAVTHVHIDFECRVGLRGDRVVLQNLAPNAGFEQPSGPGVVVFNESFANTNAYALQAGSAPTVASNVMTIANGAQVAFGSPSWGALNYWQIRWQWVSGLTALFYLHYTDANNWLRVTVGNGAMTLAHKAAGTTTTIGSAAPTLTNGSWYWLKVTQFPGAPGDPPYLSATLSADSSGLPGSVLATLSGPAASATVAMSGRPRMEASGANLQVGGAFSNVNLVTLFGPGGWSFSAIGGDTPASGTWEQSTANTYPNGPVTSFGALRMDAPPAGTWDYNWRLYMGGAPAGNWAIPVRTAGDTLSITAWTRSSGLGANASISLFIHEYDASGTLLRVGQAGGALSGNQGNWTQVGGDYTTGANCAYLDVGCRATDVSAGGASANATVWFDNAQVWNETQLSNQSGMPWCALRGVRSPASLVVSGVLGDMVAPAALAVGTYVVSWPAGGTMTFYAGRKLVTSPNAQFVAASFGAYPTSFSPTSVAALDSGSWSGYYVSATVGAGGWNPRFISPTAADAAGIYHILTRARTAQTTPNLPNLGLRVSTAQQTDPGLNLVAGTDIVGQWQGPFVYPFVASNTWQVMDAGQCNLPPFPQGALTDPSKLYLVPRAQWQDTSASGAAGNADWQALLPVDGPLLMATLNNPSNSSGAVANSWLWVYADGLLLNRGANGDTATWTLSVESGPTPNPAVGAGGVGNGGSGALNVNSAADPALVLDPAQKGANGTTGVNQIVAVLADQVGSVYPIFTEISYTPLYLYPR